MAVTRENIENKISYYELLIEDYKSKINSIRKDIKSQRKLLKDLEEYEKTPLADRTLRRYISRESKTVPIFDSFEETNEKGFYKYERLINATGWLLSGYKQYTVYYIIERLCDRDYVGDITATDFKNGYFGKLADLTKEKIDEEGVFGEDENRKEIIFDKPYLIRAQNSKNRTGYGNEYNGYDLVYQGTLYGETTNYAIVGFILTPRGIWI